MRDIGQFTNQQMWAITGTKISFKYFTYGLKKIIVSRINVPLFNKKKATSQLKQPSVERYAQNYQLLTKSRIFSDCGLVAGFA